MISMDRSKESINVAHCMKIKKGREMVATKKLVKIEQERRLTILVKLDLAFDEMIKYY